VIPAYPGFSLLAAAVVVLLELKVLRTGVFRQKAYWIAMAIVFAFQVPVDGWMTKLSDPIVIYNPEVLSGWRWPLDIPTEEFAYAWAMLTLAILVWERLGRRGPQPTTEDRASAGIRGRL
jgi:lycopene cyclase domain-containing protein